jgi:hypothetical protein
MLAHARCDLQLRMSALGTSALRLVGVTKLLLRM